MHANEVVLGHVLAECRIAPAVHTFDYFQSASRDLLLLSSGASEQGRAGDLAAELLQKVNAMVHGKQIATKGGGLDLLSSVIPGCDRRTFLENHLDWCSCLISSLRTDLPPVVQCTLWKCLALLFHRVHLMLDIPGVRRDGATMVPKLVSLLQQLHPTPPHPSQSAAQNAERAAQPSPALAPPVLRALLAALTALPAPFRQHLKFLDQLLCGQLMQPQPAQQPPILLAACVASLPRVNGDGASWSTMAQRLLRTAHVLLDLVLLGLDDQDMAKSAREALDPAADPLPHLPPPSSSSLPQYLAAHNQLQASFLALQALMERSYPSAVPIPSLGVLLTITRILTTDDASGATGQVAGGTKYAHLCMRLPALHAAALRLLCTLLRSAGAQLAPLYLTTARLVGDYLDRVASGGAGALTPLAPKVRCLLYQAVALLLQTAGVGVVRALSGPIARCARWELYGESPSGGLAGIPEAQQARQQQPPAKRRRKGKGGKGQGGADDGAYLGPNDDAGSQRASLQLEAQTAMLRLLEGLLSRGGGLMEADHREQVDAMAAHMAATSAAAVQKLAQDADGDASRILPLQLAAYSALMTASLAPAQHRPPYLPLALRLFKGGLMVGGSDLRDFCSRALLSCEALMHPRSCPHPPPIGLLAAATSVQHTVPADCASGGLAEGPQGQGEGKGISLGPPRFWNYLEEGFETGRRGAWDGASDGFRAEGSAGQSGVAGARGLAKERDGLPDRARERGDVIMNDVPQAQHGAVPAAGTSDFGHGSLGADVAIPVQQVRSSMAALLAAGGASSAGAAPAIPAMASGSPLHAKAQGKAGNASPPLALPVPAVQVHNKDEPLQGVNQDMASGVVLAGRPEVTIGSPPAVRTLPERAAPALGDDSDSDGPLPEIDSGNDISDEEGS